MKIRLLLSLLCICLIQNTLANVGMRCDNTLVLKTQKFFPYAPEVKKTVFLPNSRFLKTLPGSLSAPALSSTMVLKQESEPNNFYVTANPLGGTDVKVKANINPGNDIDFYSFTATAGSRVYVATQTSFSSTGSNNSVIEIIMSNGISVLEIDDDDGSFGPNSSSIAGAIIPNNGVFYIKVRHNNTTEKLLPYFLYFRLQSGSPTAETEPNNTSVTANALPASGWVTGNLSSKDDADFFSISLNAGDTIFVGLDFDPERDSVTWNGQVAFGPFMADNFQNPFYLSANSNNSISPNSESFFLTVKTTGTYYIAVAPFDNTFGTYAMSTSVLPASTAATSTYTNNTTLTLPPATGSYTSTINIPDDKRIDAIKILLNITHDNMADLDIRLTSPSGNTVILFTDIGVVSPLNVKLDDDAAVPIGSFTSANNIIFQLPFTYRLEWFKGQLTKGVWTLIIDDDTPGNGGTLNSWGIEILEEPPITGTITNIYSNDFEYNDGGFIHGGAQDEWERGTPSFAPITTCNSGTNCWKTDLDNTYNFNANFDLVSPNIFITDLGAQSAYLTWAQKYQFASAHSDNINAFVEIQEIGTINSKRIWEWRGASMIDKSYGSPNYVVNQSAGWGVIRVNVSEYSGKTIRIVFHFDSGSTSTQLAGWAIDDVTIFKTFCPTSQELSTNITGVYNRIVAGTTITATNQISTDQNTQSPANIVYQGGNSVTLSPGFKAEATGGTVFMAQVGGCN